MPEKRRVQQMLSLEPRTRMYFSEVEEESARDKSPMSLPCHDEEHPDSTILPKLSKNFRSNFLYTEAQHLGIYFEYVEEIIKTSPSDPVSSSNAMDIPQVHNERRFLSLCGPSSYSTSLTSSDSCSPVDCRMQLFREKLKDESLPMRQRMKYRKCLERFEKKQESDRKS